MPYPNIDDDIVISNRIMNFDEWYDALQNRIYHDFEGNVDYILNVKFDNCIFTFIHEPYDEPINVIKNVYYGYFKQSHICISKCVFMSIDNKTGIETSFTLEDILQENL